MSRATHARSASALLTATLAILASAAIVCGLARQFDAWEPALAVYGVFWVTVVTLFHPRTDRAPA